MILPELTADEYIKHFIAYVRWDIVLDWKKEEIKAGRIRKSRQLKPYAYGTAVRKVYDRIQKNDILWILTIPRFGKYKSFPSLNAMIVVNEKIDQKSEKNKKQLKKIPKYIKSQWDPIKEKGWRYVIIGSKNMSRYFPINNAYNDVVKPIFKKEIINKLEERIDRNYYGYVAQHFQKIREIEKDAGRQIANHQKEIRKKAVLFVSYRHGRGNKIVKDIVERLLKEEINCWLDISRIPPKLSKKDYREIKKYFEYELINAIKESHGFQAIKRNDYFDSDWTVLEYENAKKEEIFRTKRGEHYYFDDVELAKVLDKEARQRLVERIKSKFGIKI